MRHEYDDIRSRIGEPPRWFDEHGTPRYSVFKPTDVPDIYANEAVLFEIACQACAQRFLVALSLSRYRLLERPAVRTIAETIRAGALEYLDPPNVGCCPAGPTMTSDTIRVVEYWHKPAPGRDWARDPALERVAQDG